MKPILTVSEVTQILKNLIEESGTLRQVYIRGEISNFKHHSSGHMYFTLKDDKSQIRCVMFRNRNFMLPFSPKDGMKIIALGYISVFARSGQYQLYVEDIEPDGIGALHMAFEELKAKLQGEGLFDVKQKRTLPFVPYKIGVVTSITGAAIRDILTVVTRRFPGIDILISPVLVQGPEAPEAICLAISDLNKIPDVDVMIVGRGGGSIEELWAFNDERVARAIFKSSIPIISAVGHETDFTIADFVADKRAPTPSAAGELAVPEKGHLEDHFRKYEQRMISAMRAYISFQKHRIKYIKESTVYINPETLTANFKVMLDENFDQLQRTMSQQIELRRSQLREAASKLNALSPLNVLARGYCIATRAVDAHIIRGVEDVRVGEMMDIILSHGNISCEVMETERRVNENEGQNKV